MEVVSQDQKGRCKDQSIGSCQPSWHVKEESRWLLLPASFGLAVRLWLCKSSWWKDWRAPIFCQEKSTETPKNEQKWKTSKNSKDNRDVRRLRYCLEWQIASVALNRTQDRNVGFWRWTSCQLIRAKSQICWGRHDTHGSLTRTVV